jgi:NAD-dependent deacetylase
MKKIVVFTGAGISQESGIDTFRDLKNGLWYNYNVDEVATASGLKKDPDKVNEFHNLIRAKMKDVKPNGAHKALAELEKYFDVTVITQNIDNLHEMGGSSNVLHLHGNLFKSRSTLDPSLIYDCLGDINNSDRCEKGSRLRPHTVL